MTDEISSVVLFVLYFDGEGYMSFLNLRGVASGPVMALE